LAKYKCYVISSDEIVLIGDRYYIKACATIINESGASISTSAFAREEESKKGMDASQLTGATSSYARKYALNGLFAIDDNKDSDTTNKGDEKEYKKERQRLDLLKEKVESCKASDDVLSIWNDNQDLKGNSEFAEMIKEKGTKLKNA